jgi:eukaryotic-like serine/threonine-protein kinase
VQTQPGIVYQFGPFDVNPASGELLKNGRRIRLQEQPYRLLVALLENAGEVISREELRSRLWPGDTFVDFDGSLRVAVGKLREALDDNADDPRYIETIPKRGYRFLVPEVRRMGAAYQAAHEIAAPHEDLEFLSADVTPIAVSPKHYPLLRYGIAAIAAVILTAVGTVLWQQRTHTNPLTDKDMLVLADFANATGDPVFDGTLRQGLSIQLEQSPFLSIVSDEKIQQTLGLMGQPADAKLVSAIAREVCQRTASAAVLDGSIARIGTQYLLTLKAINCESGKTLASTEAQASDENHVLNALGKVSVEIRNKLGESLSTIQKFDTPLEEATTPSLEALKAYTSAIQAMRTKGPDAATPFLKHAVELDSNFAVAYAYLGVQATTGLEPGLSVDYRTKAYELRDRTSKAEKYWITATYHKGVTGNIQKAIEACELWIQDYPRAEMPHLYLAAAVLPVVGQYERALEESSEGVRLRPDFPLAYAFRIRAYTALNRFDEAKAIYAQALERKLHTPFIDVEMYNLAFAQNDTAGIERYRRNGQIRCKAGGPAAVGSHDVEYGRRYCRLFRAP